MKNSVKTVMLLSNKLAITEAKVKVLNTFANSIDKLDQKDVSKFSKKVMSDFNELDELYNLLKNSPE